MLTKISFTLILLFPILVFAQEEATTLSGKVVLLFPDGTWKYRVEKIDSALVSSDSTVVDSLASAKPEVKVKQYSDTVIGFKGFLKTKQLVIPSLPDYSDGLYEYRVKVNKEGYVKEVITMKRGPNGQTDGILRNAIYKFKLRPDGSIVAPLTEGTIRFIIPAVPK
jgi:hypothetical protein